MQVQPAAQPGDVIDGRYTILRMIGRGGMADVFAAADAQSGTEVAIKILRASIARYPEAKARFGHEARVQEMIRHPNVAVLYGTGVSNGHPYLAIELLRGRTLAHVLKQEGRVVPARAAHYAWQALSGLAATHALGVMHRDLKPGNLMLEPTGQPIERVVLIDFGFAALDGATGLTAAGFIVGSLSYMAPERLRGDAVDPRSDLYSIGVVLYELLVGTRPFVGEDAELIAAHLDQVAVAPSQAAPDAGISPALDAVVMRSLSKQARDRAESAAAMAKELEDAFQ